MSENLNHILLVEDEPDIQVVAKVALETLGGFQVQIASNGQQALQHLENNKPDLIILDVMMPVMDGPTTLGTIQKRFSQDNFPVVFMTAKVMSDEVRDLKNLGAVEVIQKPFDPMTLATTVTNIWKCWKLAA